MGERFSRVITVDYQVGQAEPTSFPERVGNCQICHRGVISLDNVRHGMSVDYLEGCKSCHDRDVFVSPRLTMVNMIHTTHVSSFKFPQAKNNCTLCHLTRESALRPSLHVCASCHPEPHGTMFQAMHLSNDFDPTNDVSVYGNCARQCHQQTPPTQHILPTE
jgi:hypothetical protein